MKITAKEKHVFVRTHDNFRFGNEVHLGYDYSTGVKREDKEEYYHEEPMTEEELERLQEQMDLNEENKQMDLNEENEPNNLNKDIKHTEWFKKIKEKIETNKK